MTTILTLQNWREAKQDDIRSISSIISIINRILKVVILSILSKYTYCATNDNYTKIFLVTTSYVIELVCLQK